MPLPASLLAPPRIDLAEWSPVPCGHAHAHLREILACAVAHPEVVRFRIERLCPRCGMIHDETEACA